MATSVPRPGKQWAVGRLFIPIYGLYWNYVAIRGLGQDLNRYAAQRAIVLRAPISDQLARRYSRWAIVSSALGQIPILGVFASLPAVFLMVMLTHEIKDACVAIAEAKQTGKV